MYIFFLMYLSFISFSCLISLDRISGDTLNRNGVCGHPCLLLSLSGKVMEEMLV